MVVRRTAVVVEVVVDDDQARRSRRWTHALMLDIRGHGNSSTASSSSSSSSSTFDRPHDFRNCGIRDALAQPNGDMRTLRTFGVEIRSLRHARGLHPVVVVVVVVVICRIAHAETDLDTRFGAREGRSVRARRPARGVVVAQAIPVQGMGCQRAYRGKTRIGSFARKLDHDGPARGDEGR